MFKSKSDKDDVEIEEGQIYFISNFRVTGPKALFNVLEAEYSIAMSRDTCFNKAQSPGQLIPTYYFQLVEFDSLEARKKDNRLLSGE